MKKASKEKLINVLRNRSVRLWNRYMRFCFCYDSYYRVDLSYAELNGAELNDAELNRAILNGAELNDAELNGAELNDAELNRTELNGADFDYSCWPLHCGSLDVKMTTRIFCQLIYHTAKPDYVENDDDIIELKNSELFKKVCNKFHRIDECGEI